MARFIAKVTIVPARSGGPRSIEMQPPIGSAEIKQRVEPRLEPRAFDLADQDPVIAAVVNRMAGAFEHRQRIEQQRSALFARGPGGRAGATAREMG